MCAAKPSPSSATAETLASHAGRRPRLAVRVGVTGHRDLSSTYACAEPAIRRAVETVLAAIAASAGAIAASAGAVAATDGAAAVYAAGPPVATVVSPLAAGADQLVAETGLRLGFGLAAPLPFARDEYERDFTPAERAQFRALLARADRGVIALDGRRDDAVIERSYAAAGRRVVENCDVLIAIWQAGRRQGGGGTADIIAYARRCEVPVVWIPADRPGGACVMPEAGADPGGARSPADGVAEVATLVRGLLDPPPWLAAPPRRGAAGRRRGERALAELVRQGSYLALLGRALPVRRPARAAPDEGALWYFRALSRDRPIVAATIDGAYLDEVRRRYRGEIVAPQIRRRPAPGRAARRLADGLKAADMALAGIDPAAAPAADRLADAMIATARLMLAETGDWLIRSCE